MQFAALFALLIGVGMLVQWTASYVRDQIPELETEPVRIGFHIAAELITALCLITAGIGLLLNTSWAVTLYLVAIGMLFYTSIVSPGYFAQRGQWGWLGLFALIIILGMASIPFVL